MFFFLWVRKEGCSYLWVREDGLSFFFGRRRGGEGVIFGRGGIFFFWEGRRGEGGIFGVVCVFSVRGSSFCGRGFFVCVGEREWERFFFWGGEAGGGRGERGGGRVFLSGGEFVFWEEMFF